MVWMGAGLLAKLLHQPEIGSFFKAVALAIKRGMPLESQLLPKRDLFRNWEVSMSYRHRQGQMDRHSISLSEGRVS